MEFTNQVYVQAHLGPGVLIILFILNTRIEAVSELVTERVLREDKTHSTGMKLSDPDILVPNEP